jgi:hypothetical protein
MDTQVTKRHDTSLERYIGILVVLTLLLIIYSMAYFTEADGYKQSGVLEKTPQTFYMRGDLTAKTEDKPYGSHIIGDYLVIVDTETVKIAATLDNYFQKRIFVGWLLDSNSDKMLKIGIFDNNKLTAKLTMDIKLYDAIIVTEKLQSRTSTMDVPVGGAFQALQ